MNSVSVLAFFFKKVLNGAVLLRFGGALVTGLLVSAFHWKGPTFPNCMESFMIFLFVCLFVCQILPAAIAFGEEPNSLHLFVVNIHLNAQLHGPLKSPLRSSLE